MLDILGWIVLGLIAGAIAKAIMPGKDPGGILVTMIIGILGAVIGGFVGKALFDYGTVDSTGAVSEPGFLMSLVMAVIGSIVLLVIYRLVRGQSLRGRDPIAHS